VNRREFLTTGIRALFGAALAGLGLVKAEEPEPETLIEDCGGYRIPPELTNNIQAFFAELEERGKIVSQTTLTLSPLRDFWPMPEEKEPEPNPNAQEMSFGVGWHELEPVPDTIHVRFTESEEVSRLVWNPVDITITGYYDTSNKHAYDMIRSAFVEL
jgi:hypothetical protein